MSAKRSMKVLHRNETQTQFHPLLLAYNMLTCQNVTGYPAFFTLYNVYYTTGSPQGKVLIFFSEEENEKLH